MHVPLVGKSGTYVDYYRCLTYNQPQLITGDRKTMAPKGGQKPNKVVANAMQGDTMACPPGQTPEFIAVWQRMVEDFPADYFRESDRDVMTVYCRTVVQYADVSRQLDDEGFLVETTTGTKQNPLVAVQTQLSGTLSTYARMLRVTPISRVQNTQVPKTPALKTAVEETPRRGLRLAGVA